MIVAEASVNRLEIWLEAALYNENVVFKCFYWYGKEFDVVIHNADDGERFIVVLTPRRESVTPDTVEELLSRVKRDLIDFKTRDIVARETQSIRELLVAKAFAHADELDEPPLGSIADLGGIEPREHHAGT